MDVSVVNSFVLLIGMVIGFVAYLVGAVHGRRTVEARMDALRKRNRMLTKELDAHRYRLKGYGSVVDLRDRK